MTAIITATVALTMGVTVYVAEEGKGLSCPEHKYTITEEWAAVPLEWMLSGKVSCGDRVYGCLPNGHCLDGVPVMDSGCLLHYPVWPVADKVPFGLDLPIHMRELYGNFHTGRMQFEIYRLSEQSWWTPTKNDLVAWDTRYCNGPLTMTMESWPWMHKPN